MMKKNIVIFGLVCLLLGTTIPAVIVSANPIEIHVPDDYTTIQAAIDNANDGDKIFVHDGTYSEYILIDDIDLQLIAIGEVTIDGVNPDSRGATVTIYNSECTIDGFDIDGNYLGILARYDVDVNIKNNYVYDYLKNGITVIGFDDDYASANIMDNIIEGRGQLPYGDWAQNGIQFTWCEGIIKDNTVSDNWYLGGYWTATNILLYAYDENFEPVDADIQVVKNTIIDGQTGVYAYASGIKITDNTIDGEQYGQYPATAPENGVDYYEYGSWGVILYGDNCKVIKNTIGPYDVGVENYLTNSKIIRNTFIDCVEEIVDYGGDTKVQANIDIE